MLLQRKISYLYIPPVDLLDESEDLMAWLKSHVRHKNILQGLLLEGTTHEELLEACEEYIGTENMDDHINKIEENLDNLIFR